MGSSAHQPVAMSPGAGLAVDPLLWAGAVMLAVGALVAGLAERMRLPGLLLFLGLGMVVADDGLAWVRFDDAQLAQSLGVVALVVILFEGGLTMQASDLRAALGPATLLATLGTALTAGIVALVVGPLVGLDTNSALLLGAVVASTDAAAVFSVVRRVPLPRRTVGLLEAESGLNDPMAVLLVVGVLEVWRGDADALGLLLFGLVQLGGGVVVGLALGFAAAFLLERLRFDSSALSSVLALAIGGITYGTAALLGASGFLAVYLCGVVIAARVTRQRRTLRRFCEALAAMAQIGLFLMLGLLVFPSRLPSVALLAAAATVALVVLARPIAVVCCLAPLRVGGRELALVSVAGLRGAVPIVLATFPLTAGHPDGAQIFDVVFFVVVLSTAVQGVAIAPLARRLRLPADPPGAGAAAEVVAVEAPGIDVIELRLPADAAVAGRRLDEVPIPGSARVSVVVRDGRSLVPSGATVLAVDDVLVVTVPSDDPHHTVAPGEDLLRRIERWADRGPDDATAET